MCRRTIHPREPPQAVEPPRTPDGKPGRRFRIHARGAGWALETALLLAEVLGPGHLVEEAATGLAANDSTDDFFAAIDGWTEDTIIVGHLPFMSRMAARLVTGDEDETVVHFKPGSVACLERGENGGGWTVQWFIRPELLGG